MGLRGEPHQQLEKDTGLHLRLTSSRNKGDDLAASVGARSEIAPEVQDESSDEIGRKAVHVVGDILLRHCDAQNPRDDCGTVRGDCRRPAKHRTGLLRLSDRRHLTCKKKAPVMHKEDRRGVQSLEGVERALPARACDQQYPPGRIRRLCVGRGFLHGGFHS